jgi:hypothetical protein
MVSPETVIAPDQLEPVGNNVRSSELDAERTAWSRDAEIGETDALHPSGLWRGIAIAMPFAAAFWALVWFAITWAFRG